MPEDQGTVASGVLSSWKEIAAYLGVTVRTAQYWEKQRGLPVRRLPGPRSRIDADPAALDRWKSSNAAPEPAATPSPSTPTGRRWWPHVLWTGAVLVVLGVTLGWWHRPTPQPARVRVERDTLLALDGDGVVLWRKQFPFLLAPAAYDGANAGRYAWLGDLDADGHTEVLFVPDRPEHNELPMPLICYSDRGVERWRYTPTRQVRTRTESFAPVYHVNAFLPVPARNGRPGMVFVSSVHYLYYPCQVARLSAAGVLQREYWHSGQLGHLALGLYQGRDELYAAGVSNAWKAATLVILDPEGFRGVSQEPEAPEYQLLGMSMGRERARVIFPRSDLNHALHVYNTVFDLMVRPGAIIVNTEEDPGPDGGAGILHEFSMDLRQHDVTISDAYQAIHQRLEQRGELHHPMPPAERAALEQVRIIPGH